MLPRPFIITAWITASALAFVSVGCKRDLKPHTNVEDMSHAALDGSDIQDISVGISDAATDAAIPDAAQDASLVGGMDAGDAGTGGPGVSSLCSSGCQNGNWMCDGLCVSPGDWHYGCGLAGGCQPCTMAHAKPAHRPGMRDRQL